MEINFNKIKRRATSSSNNLSNKRKGRFFFLKYKNTKPSLAENYKHKQAFQKEVDRAKVF